MKRRAILLDPWLLLFLLLMSCASVIAAHGAFVFFGYLVDPGIAVLATAVTALGIPALDAAGTLERSWKRWLYWAGGLLLLGMETLANYFAGQAVFAARVAKEFAGQTGVDLAELAQRPVGRVLVVVYLALPSLIVAYFAFAAAGRWRALRTGQARRSRRSMQLRALVRRLVGMVREARAAVRAPTVDVAALESEIAQLKEQATRVEAESAQRRAEMEQAVRGVQQHARDLAQALHEKETEVAQLRFDLAQPLMVDGIDLLAIARKLRERDVPLRETAQLIGTPESTLRNRLKASANGHAVEA